MKFDTFVKEHELKLDGKTLDMCHEGLSIMRRSVDAIHDERHIEDIFTNLDYLIQRLPEVKKLVTFDSLLMAICWHDTWKSTKNPKNPLNFLYHQFYEGMGSARLFKKKAEEEELKKNTINKTTFIIRKHSFFQFLPTNDIAVKILLDLDDIEMWNVQRIRRAETTFFINKKGIYKKMEKIFYRARTGQKTNIPELQDLLDTKKKEFMKLFSGNR
jgi:hypothetical protein